MTLGMAWLLCLVGTPVSIGVMILITKAEHGRSRSNKSDN